MDSIPLHKTNEFSLLLSLAISFAIAYYHFTILGFLSKKLTHATTMKNHKIFLSMMIIISTHLVSVFAYSVCFMVMEQNLGMGQLLGLKPTSIHDYFYYSLIVYTSVGFGDIYPVGGIRILTGLETLNGLILISWTASYSYIMMTRYWDFNNSNKCIVNNTQKEDKA